MIAHFRLLPFLAGVAIASLIFLVYKPEKQVIRQYPHPSEAKEKVFRDQNKACYKYTSHEVDCDANEENLKDYPLQG
jgi:hypothetical protein